MPEAGICTCGYGHQYRYKHDGDEIEMYSVELLQRLCLPEVIIDSKSHTQNIISRSTNA